MRPYFRVLNGSLQIADWLKYKTAMQKGASSLVLAILCLDPASAADTVLAVSPGSTDARLAEAAMARDMNQVRSLLAEKGAQVNALGPFDTPALHWVVRIEDTVTAKLLLEAGADPNLMNAYQLLPLHLAIENTDEAMVNLLLEFGANPDLPDRTGESPLLLAARTGSAPVLAALLARGADVNEVEPHFQQTSLMLAVRSGNEAAVRLLLEHGADPGSRSAAGPVPEFRLPAQNAGSKGVGIVRGGWPERGERAPVGGAKTPLLYATRQGDLALTRLLVEAGADLERSDENSVTPLLNAILNGSVVNPDGSPTGHIATAAYLIAQGANVNAADWYGESPLWAAVSLRNLEVRNSRDSNKVDREAALQLITTLIEHGADVNVRTREQPPNKRFITFLGDLSWVDFTGQTPFLRAALSGDVTVMQLLLDHGADPNITTYAGTTPLMAAAGINWVVNQTWDEGPQALLDAVVLAHKSGNDIDAVNSMGLTAVHGAANKGADHIIRYLADNGAKLDVADKEGRTPLTWAHGVFLATHPPVDRPDTAALLETLIAASTH